MTKHTEQQALIDGFIGLAPKILGLNAKDTETYMDSFSRGENKRIEFNLKGITETDINPINLCTKEQLRVLDDVFNEIGK